MSHDTLDCRDGHEQTDVAPVLIDRFPGGGVRIVVTYPRDAQLRVRNRFVFTVGAVIAWAVVAMQLIGDALHDAFRPSQTAISR